MDDHYRMSYHSVFLLTFGVSHWPPLGLAFLYFFFGEGLPGILGHAGMDLHRILLPNYGSTRATV